jgi:hypothetical protein
MSEKKQVEDYLALRFARQEKREKLMQELLSGANEAAELMLATRTRQTERAFVLTVAMALEGTMAILRQEILEDIRLNATVEPFTISETVLLQGRAFDIKQNGRVMRKATRIPLESRVRFTLICLAKAYGLSHEHLNEDALLSNMRVMVRLRNRLVHPKTSDDLTISQGDFDSTRACVAWLHDLLATIREAAVNLWQNMSETLHVPGARELAFFEIADDMTDSDEI